MTTIPGPVALTWRGSGLYAGAIFAGRVELMLAHPGSLRSHRWRVHIMSCPLGELLHHFATEAEARAALETEVVKALGTAENTPAREAYAAGWRDCASLAIRRVSAYEGDSADEVIEELEVLFEDGPVTLMGENEDG